MTRKHGTPLNIVTRHDCCRIVQKILHTKEFEIIDCNVNRISNAAGFLGDYFKITLLVTHGGSEKTVNLFAKTMPNASEAFKVIALQAFNKEEFVYSQYFEIIKSKGFGDILDFTAKFYLFKTNEVLVLEDLSVRGYEGVDLMVPPDYEIMKNMAQQLAKFHACSLLLEESQTADTGRLFRIDKEYPEFMRDVNFTTDVEIGKVNLCGARTVYEYILDKFPDIPTNITTNEFKNRVKIVMDRMFERNLRPSQTYRNVLCHGDAWLGNTLIKRNGSGKIESSLLIDFQLIRYCPPVLDLTLAVYTGTDKKWRNEFLSRLLEDYHEQLTSILRRYGIDVDQLLDFKTFLKCFDDYKATGIFQALCYAQVLHIPKHKQNKVNSNKDLADYFYGVCRSEFIEKENVWSDHNYFYRMRDLIQDLYEAVENNELI